MATLDDNITDFVAEFTGVARERLSPDVTLLGDLGVDGADGWELIAAFGQRFEVNLSSFQPERHFGPEGLPLHAPLEWLCCLLSWSFRKRQTPEERAGLDAIRISDLMASAREKRWML